jgi:hypothetical protein
MSDAFDGAGKKPFKDPSYRAAFTMLLVLVVVVVGLLLAASGVLPDDGSGVPQFSVPQLESP